MLTVCFLWTQCFLGIQNWTTSLLTHFSWQTLSLKVYLWAIHHEGQGHKNSSQSPNNCLTNVNVFKHRRSWPGTSKSSYCFKRTVAAFYGPLLFPSSHGHSFNCFRPKHLVHTSHLPPPPQNQLSTLPSPVFQSSVNFRLNLQTHRAVRYTGRTLTHCTSEPRP